MKKATTFLIALAVILRRIESRGFCSGSRRLFYCPLSIVAVRRIRNPLVSVRFGQGADRDSGETNGGKRSCKVIGYKAFDKNLCCRGFQYEVGKTYTKDTPKENLRCCSDTGFHFCRELSAIERSSDYKLSESRICEILAGDYVRDDEKYCTNSITILREITGDEKNEILNSGDWNSGNRNSGYRNSGDWNSGNWNSGYRNSGDWNSGNWNSGNCNSGDCNSGYRNSGNWNSGDCNSGDWNSGYFNSNEPNARMFNKMTNIKVSEVKIPDWCRFDLTVWVSHDTASDEEKIKHKREIETSGGFLRSLDYKDAWRLAWNKASVEERKKLFDLPNWNNEVFKEITGIDAEKEMNAST